MNLSGNWFNTWFHRFNFIINCLISIQQRLNIFSKRIDFFIQVRWLNMSCSWYRTLLLWFQQICQLLMSMLKHCQVSVNIFVNKKTKYLQSEIFELTWKLHLNLKRTITSWTSIWDFNHIIIKFVRLQVFQSFQSLSVIWILNERSFERCNNFLTRLESPVPIIDFDLFHQNVRNVSLDLFQFKFWFQILILRFQTFDFRFQTADFSFHRCQSNIHGCQVKGMAIAKKQHNKYEEHFLL